MAGMRRRALFAAALAASLAAGPACAAGRIALIVDDMGNNRIAGLRALALPGAVTYAFLPGTRHAPELLDAARAAGKEVMLHLPMQARDHNDLLGPGALHAHMDREEFMRTVRYNIDQVPSAAGVNNHMGSLLTTRSEQMRWLMRVLRERGLYFLDSRTVAGSVAADVARAEGVPARVRDVFLDNTRSEIRIREAFAQLVRIARTHGSAIGIVHPHALSIATVGADLARLDAHDVELVPLSTLLYETPESAQPAAMPVPNRQP
ncbi:MAG: divergent polysaccharide deacetylase family protein [Gammaproteobacteria bacterium]